jgi:hypothetical protein
MTNQCVVAVVRRVFVFLVIGVVKGKKKVVEKEEKENKREKEIPN